MGLTLELKFEQFECAFKRENCLGTNSTGVELTRDCALIVGACNQCKNIFTISSSNEFNFKLTVYFQLTM